MVLVRRVVLCALLLLLALPALGLGLGALHHHSRLGEPLAATIDIVIGKEDLDPDQIRTKQLSPLQARELGIELVSTFQRYSLTPKREGGGLIIDVSSEGDINEPYINLLVELSWPDGRVYREYTLLLDPPKITGAEATPVERARRTSVPAKPSAGVDINVSADRYRVQPGDSLSKIALRLSGSSPLNSQQIMAWLLEKNPKAFINGDKNRIKAGAQLRLPQAESNVLGTAYLQSPAKQQQAAIPPVPTPVSTATPVAIAETPGQVDEKTRLTLTTERQDAQRLLQSRPDDLSISQLQSRLDAVNELNERLMRDSREMQERLRLIEGSSYMQNLEELLALKERQVAELKRQLESSGQAVSEQSLYTKQGDDQRFSQRMAEPDQDDSQRIDSATAAELAKTEPVVTTKRSYFWWWLLIVLGFLALGVFYVLNRSTHQLRQDTQPVVEDDIDETVTLDELDQLMAQQGEESRPIPLRPEPPKDEYLQAAKSAEKKAKKPKATPKKANHQAQKPDTGKPSREGWRADDEVLSGIQQKMQAYIPPVYEDSGVEHHDEVEDLITEALGYGKKGYYDTAEALLQAEKARNGSNERLEEAIAFLRKKKAGND